MKISSLIFTTLLIGFGEDFNTIIKTFGDRNRRSQFCHPSPFSHPEALHPLKRPS